VYQRPVALSAINGLDFGLVENLNFWDVFKVPQQTALQVQILRHSSNPFHR
jgi:hypothetical protein